MKINPGLLPADHLSTKSERRRFRKTSDKIKTEVRRIQAELMNLKQQAATEASRSGNFKDTQGKSVNFNLNQGSLSTDRFEIYTDSRSCKQNGQPVFQVIDKTGFETPQTPQAKPRLFAVRLRPNGSVFSKRYSRLGLASENLRKGVECPKRDFLASSKNPFSLAEAQNTLNWLRQISPLQTLKEHISGVVERSRAADQKAKISAKSQPTSTFIPNHLLNTEPSEPTILAFARVG